MGGLSWLPGLLRRQLYVLLLAAGFAGLVGIVLSGADGSPAYGEVRVAAPDAAGRALTDGAVMDGFGAWSPDGREIAFMRDGGIWLMGAGGEGARQLTGEEGAWDAVPAWRPDGKEVAFARTSADGDTGLVMAVDPASGKVRRLAEQKGSVGHVAWDPKGRSLYYTTNTRLMRLDLRSGKAAAVFEVKQDWEMLAGGLAISRDGKVAVFAAGPSDGRGVRYDLWVLPLEGKDREPKRLTQQGGIMPAFAPDGRRLVYRNPRADTGIFMLDLTTHALSRLVADQPRAMFFHPAFSPDGKQLLLSQLMLDGSVTPRGKLTSHLFLHKLEGSGGD